MIKILTSEMRKRRPVSKSSSLLSQGKLKWDKSATEVCTLPNGLRVVLHRVPVIDVVSVYLRVNTGSNYEGRFLGSGISHFLEHAMFLGSKNFPGKDEFSNIIQSYGGVDLNAFTGETNTCYQFSVLSHYLLPSLDALRDFIFHPLLRKEDIEEERGTIVSEMDLYDDKPADWFYRLIFSRVFSGEPNELPIIGLRKLFHNITAENLREYHRTCYRPDNLSLFLVGQFDLPPVKKYLMETFTPHTSNSKNSRNNDTVALPSGFFPGGQPGYWQPSPWAQGESQGSIRVTETCHHRVEFVRVAMVWKGCDFFHPDNYTLDIISHILASGRGSILYEMLKEKLELVEKISAFSLQTHPHSPGRFFIEFTLPHMKGREKILQAIDKVHKKIIYLLSRINTCLTEELLTGSLNTFLKSFIDEKEDFIDIASTLSHSLSYFGHLDFESEYFRYINNLSREDTVATVKRYLHPRPHLFLLLPEKIFLRKERKKIFPEANIEKVSPRNLTEFETVLEKGISSYRWREGSPQAERKISSPIILSSHNLAPTQRKSLSNGAVFLNKNITGLPKASLQLIFPGGSALEGGYYRNGSFNLLTQMFFASNYRHSKREIAETLRHHGVFYSSFSGENTLGMGFSFLKDHLPTLLEYLEPILNNNAYREADFSKEKKEVVYTLKKIKEDSFRCALQHFKKHFFGDTSYALDPKGDEKVIPTITSGEILSLKKRFVVGSHLVAHLTGDFSGKDLQQIEQILEKLPKEEQKTSTSQTPPLEQELQRIDSFTFPSFHYQGSFITDYDPGGQAHFLMGYPTPALGEEGSGALKLVSHYLEGIGGPLFKLRSSNFFKDGKALGGRCYRLGCFMKNSKHYGMLVFYASFRKEASGEHLWALEAFQKELENIRNHPIDNREIERAKTSLVAEMLTQSIKYDQISFSEGLLETYGLGHDFGDKEIAQLQALTAKKLQEAVNRYLDRDHFLAYAMKPKNHS